MLNTFLQSRPFYFWIVGTGLFCFALERLWPWRKEQSPLRRQIGQDVFFLVFNGHYFGFLLASVTAWAVNEMTPFWKSMGVMPPEQWNLLIKWPLWLQFIVFFLLRDFLQWCVHNLLHRVPWLWEVHKLHHTIKELDWIGNFRFHWGELFVYQSLTYLPLIIMGVDSNVLLVIGVISLLIGNLNHSNLHISWGPLRYVINSPRMHVWHHDIVNHHKSGQNFGIVFSFWDWLFRTAYWPSEKQQPDEIGFKGEEEFPHTLIGRLAYPIPVDSHDAASPENESEKQANDGHGD